VSLTPLDVLPVDPVANPFVSAAALLALAGACLAAWIWRRRWPALAAAWAAYLALLAPAVGLVRAACRPRPIGTRICRCRRGHCSRDGRGALGVRPQSADHHGRRVMPVLLAVLAVTARNALMPWSDSLALWTRVVALESPTGCGAVQPRVGTGGGRTGDEAAARYREVLALQPGHADARANLRSPRRRRFEREGTTVPHAADMEAAAERYRQAVALDPKRTHSQAGLGHGAGHSRAPRRGDPFSAGGHPPGVPDAEVPNALGVLLLQAEQTREARAVLEAGLAAHADNLELAHNLARLLATDPSVNPADASVALRLASTVVMPPGRDPRAVETLAARWRPIGG